MGRRERGTHLIKQWHLGIQSGCLPSFPKPGIIGPPGLLPEINNTPEKKKESLGGGGGATRTASPSPKRVQHLLWLEVARLSRFNMSWVTKAQWKSSIPSKNKQPSKYLHSPKLWAKQGKKNNILFGLQTQFIENEGYKSILFPPEALQRKPIFIWYTRCMTMAIHLSQWFKLQLCLNVLGQDKTPHPRSKHGAGQPWEALTAWCCHHSRRLRQPKGYQGIESS